MGCHYKVNMPIHQPVGGVGAPYHYVYHKAVGYQIDTKNSF